MNLFSPHFGSVKKGMRCVEVTEGREGASTVWEGAKNRRPARKAIVKIKILKQSQTMINPTFLFFSRFALARGIYLPPKAAVPYHLRPQRRVHESIGEVKLLIS